MVGVEVFPVSTHYRLYNPPTMSLHDIEYLSIWEIAHRWEGVDPDEESPEGLRIHSTLPTAAWITVPSPLSLSPVGTLVPVSCNRRQRRTVA